MELAGRVEASAAAMRVMASYSHQPPDPATFLEQMAELFTGVPMPILAQLTSPVDGLVAQEEFLSIAAARKWIDRRMKPYSVLDAEAETMRERREAEEWAKNREPLEDRALKASQMRAKAAELGRGFPMPPHQVDDWGRRLEALETFKAEKEQSQ